MYIDSIGYNLRMIRFSRNLSQNEVHKITGLRVIILCKYENNNVESYDMEILKKLADCYKVTVEEIIGDNEVHAAPLEHNK